MSNSLLNNILNATTKCTKHLASAASINQSPDVNHHDHSAMTSNSLDHSKHNLHDGMIMSFHGGYNEIILFDFWKTESVLVFVISCIILFVSAALYEGIKLLREKLIRYEVTRKRQFDLLRSNASQPISSCHCKNKNNPNNTSSENHELLKNNLNNQENDDNDNDNVIKLESKHNCCNNQNKSPNNADFNNEITNEESTILFKSISSKLFSRSHIIQSLLHMFQVSISYLLMLVFMTYNTWLCLSVVLGAGLGYFLFGLKRLSTIDINEHCH